MREHIQSAQPRGLAPVFHRQLGTKLALNEQTIESWQLAGEIDERATYHDRNVVSPRHLNFREGYAEFLKTIVDASSRRSSMPPAMCSPLGGHVSDVSALGQKQTFEA